MTIEEVVRQVLLDEHADVIREAVKPVAADIWSSRCPSWSARNVVSAAQPRFQ